MKPSDRRAVAASALVAVLVCIVVVLCGALLGRVRLQPVGVGAMVLLAGLCSAVLAIGLGRRRKG